MKLKGVLKEVKTDLQFYSCYTVFLFDLMLKVSILKKTSNMLISLALISLSLSLSNHY